MLIGEALDLVRSVMPPTPLLRADLGGEVLLKREDLGPNGSFKWRGALAALAELKRSGARAVITASTGNHGVAVAWAAVRLEMTAHVVVPENAITAKCGMIEKHGAFLYRRGANVEEAAENAPCSRTGPLMPSWRGLRPLGTNSSCRPSPTPW
jgi:threonine dehydratase